MSKITNRNMRVPFILATTLFFLWGFARNILSVLNKHFQDVFHIGIAQSSWVEVCTFLGYFLMALPAGWFVARRGYKSTMVVGLSIFALGCLLFVPCASVGSFSWLLMVFFVIACGLVFLEVSANPYVTQLGPSDTSSARLNLAQSLNGLGGIMAPLIMGGFLFRASSQEPGTLSGDSLSDSPLFVASVPYVVMGVVVLLIAFVFSRVHLPEQTEPVADDNTSVTSPVMALLRMPAFVFALVALLAYEVAEISINSFFINYSVGQMHLDAAVASRLLSVCLGSFMIGRFIGSMVMTRVSAATVLLVNGVGAVVSVVSLMCVAAYRPEAEGVQMALLLLLYLCESIMFPTIYSQALTRMPSALIPRAGSLLMMTPVGGCAFLLMGMMADSMGFVVPFLLPLTGFIVVASYGFWRFRARVH